MGFLIFFITLILFFPVLSFASITETDSSPSVAEVQTLVDNAATGDTIKFMGDATWASAVTISKAIILDGNSHTLTASGALTQGFFYVTGITSTSLLRITGFIFQLVDQSTDYGILFNQANVSLTWLRIDNSYFYYGETPIMVAGSKGVIDNNYFYNGNRAILFTAGTRAQADASWESMAAGSSDAIFIETNTFIVNEDCPGVSQMERIGTFNGGKLVIRYNTFNSDNSTTAAGTVDPIETHGSAAAGVSPGYWQEAEGCRRGQSVVEIYNNTFQGRRIDFPIKLRGSANLVFNNSIGSVVNTPRFYLREEEYYESSNWNPVRTAWPAEDQIHNSFFWNNTYNGTQINTAPSTYFYAETNINKDRDYFLHAPCASAAETDGYGNTCTHGKASFTGANGGSASYPTDGDTYATLGNMTFSATGDNEYLDYTPYTYPHPFRGDLIVPTASSYAINEAGSSFTVTFSERVTHGAGGRTGWVLTSDGGAVTATYSSGEGSGTLTYQLSRTVYSTETVTGTYTQPGTPGITDIAGNLFASVTDVAITNNSTATSGAPTYPKMTLSTGSNMTLSPSGTGSITLAP